MSRITTTRKKNDAPPPSIKNVKRECDGAAYKTGSHRHILAVLDGLDSVYRYDAAPADIFATGEPLDGLILTLLSQNTNDRNRDLAYDALRTAHPTWEDIARLKQTEIAALIKSAGLGEMKSTRMKDILARIHQDFGSYSLKSLFSWQPAKVREYLSSMTGIGPKTVACVMVFDLDMPAFPVDTHVARLSKRLGWAPEKQTPEKIQDFLEKTVPNARCRGGHLNMIAHGRQVCGARKPKCGVCTVRALCPSSAPTNTGGA